jgi:hypothetical protein
MQELLSKLREEAIYLKLTTKNEGGAVSVADMISMLHSISESYRNFVEIEYLKLNTIQDPIRLKKVLRGLDDENKLKVVDLKFESCGVYLAPNTITFKHQIPNIKESIDWKKNSFIDYKENVISPNYNNKGFLEMVEKRFTPVERQKIFKPLIEALENNQDSKIQVGLNESTKLHLLSIPNTKNRDILVPQPSQFDFAPPQPKIKKTAIAKIEYTEGSKSNTSKVLNLFDQGNEDVSVTFNEIVVNENVYKLKFPIHGKVEIEGSEHSIISAEFGLYGFGQTMDEAKVNFCEEFHYIYTRYNSLSPELLSKKVLEIKDYLNFIVYNGGTK